LSCERTTEGFGKGCSKMQRRRWKRRRRGPDYDQRKGINVKQVTLFIRNDPGERKPGGNVYVKEVP